MAITMARQRNTPPNPDEDHRLGGFSFDRFYQLNRRALIWIILGILLWLLRDFFSLIFLTFVFAFIAAPIAAFFERRLHLRRSPAICLTFGIFVLLMISMFRFIVPQVASEAFSLKNNLPQTEERLMQLRQNMVAKYPSFEPLVMNYLRSTIPDEAVSEILHAEKKVSPLSSTELLTMDDTSGTTDPAKLELNRTARIDEAVIHLFITHQLKQITDNVPSIIRLMWAASGTIALALLFSFLISLDISRLGQELRNLRASRLRDFHNEAAQPVVRFAYVVGKAIQAQGMIALVNTSLTLIGLLILGVPSLAVLSMIVFLCSFVPVLGVFISTIPILLVALNAGGINLALLSVLMVIIVHAIEAYLLNPFIYGKHLKINPVLVLIILFVGHHAFGVWGMLLGVPVAHYFIHDVFGVPVWSERRMARKPQPPNDHEPKPLTLPDDPVDL